MTSTAIPMTAGILALIEHILLTQALVINRTMLEAHSGNNPGASNWDEACRQAFFKEGAQLADAEGVDLNEQTYRAILGLNLDDEMITEMKGTTPLELPKRFAFDPWLGQGRGGIVRLSEEGEGDTPAKPGLLLPPTGAGATVMPMPLAGATSVDDGLDYRGEMRDWLVADSLCEAKGDQEATAKLEADPDGIPYEVEVKRNGEQVYMLMSRFGVEVASVIFEVSNGVPALHIGDGFENNLHVHFAHGGAVLTPDQSDADFQSAPIDRYSYEEVGALLLPLQHESLEEHRQAMFDMLFEAYDFQGDVVSTGATVTQESGNGEPALWEMRVNTESDGIPMWLTFKVRFMEGTAIPSDVIALDTDTGAEIGSVA